MEVQTHDESARLQSAVAVWQVFHVERTPFAAPESRNEHSLALTKSPVRATIHMDLADTIVAK